MILNRDIDWTDVVERLRTLSESATGAQDHHALRCGALVVEMYTRQTVDLDDATPIIAVPRVCVESPLRGDYERNVLYADACMQDCLERDEAPFLGHLLYPRVLNDAEHAHRRRGIDAHLAWLRAADRLVLYIDLGVSSGMREAVRVAEELRLPVAARTLGLGWMERITKCNPTKGF